MNLYIYMIHNKDLYVPYIDWVNLLTATCHVLCLRGAVNQNPPRPFGHANAISQDQKAMDCFSHSLYL